MPDSRPRRTKAARPRSSRHSLPARGPPKGPLNFPVVGIGASAGGLDACRKLVGAMPAGNGMAFILVQHLDPTHESMMVDLLAGHTALTVREATDGMPIERDHLYVIPPGTYLSVADGALHLSQPQARHGARLPFDFLAAFAGGGLRRTRRLRDSLGNRGRRQPGPEGGEGEWRAGHRAGPRRGRL